MEVILLSDVKGVGKKNQTVKVSDGYANNFLLPRKLAVPSSKKSQEILENQKENARIADENARKEATLLAKKLETITCEFSLKGGNAGRTFGSISLKQIEDQLETKFGITVDKRKFLDKGPLDSFGFYKLKIDLYKGVIGEINVHIVEEGK
ncbi:MAG: 50S ribosomal protein L9 [Bacilli bacterium]|nr:50S ribosomal protein L9 [Bacilli bacterium]